MSHTLQTALHHLSTTLQAKSPTPKDDALALIESICHHPLLHPITHPQTPLDNEDWDRLEQCLKRRLQGEPIAYILGKQAFWKDVFTISPATLIPRSDTESMIESVLATLDHTQPLSLLEMGCGSGCIILSLAKECPTWKMHALDQSKAALNIAQHNAQQLGIDAITWHCSDWYQALDGMRFDAILSNPPYIKADDPHLEQGDLRFEPEKALTSGPSGLEALFTIIDQAPKHLNPNGYLFLEHGFDQAQAVTHRLALLGFDNIRHQRDLQGHVRISYGKISSTLATKAP